VTGWFCPRCGHESATEGPCPRDGEPLARVSSHDLIGRRLGEYTVLAALGGGAFGSVYRAVHARSGLLVAIKLLHQPIDQTESQRVITEARAAATLKHANVAQVYDLALTTDRRPYIVMQLLEGGSLASVLRSPLPVAFALGLANDMLAGLAVAHARGVIHRDLKPDNVFVANGRAILVDFGLAKLVADPAAPNLTITGDAIGTPMYMAPEQINSRPVDHRADLYAVACVLFEMLAGRPPFQGSTFMLFEAHTKQPPPSVAAVRPEVPAHVDAAIARALAKDPDARFADATEMRHALAGVIDTRPRGRRRWPIVAALSAVAIAGLATVALVAGERTTPPAPPDAPAKVVIPPPEPDEPVDPQLESALTAVADNIAAGRYTRDQVLRMRCDMARARRDESRHTPRAIRSYNARFQQMLEGQLAGVDFAKACAPPERPERGSHRVPFPPPLTGEPRLGDGMEAALHEVHDQLDNGTFGRAHAVEMMCGIYRMRDKQKTHAIPYTRAFHRRYELLMRGYFPDLDAAECSP
jgi:hypothetical protein